MKAKLQVFISSTNEDLKEERDAAIRAIREAGHIPGGMEFFKSGKPQMETIRKWIDESDIYVLILGGRYGSIETSSNKSYTELEYQYAVSKNKPLFVIVLSKTYLYTKASQNEMVISDLNNEQYMAFKEYVLSNKVVDIVNNVAEIKSSILKNLNDIQEDYNLRGWVKLDSIVEPFNITYYPVDTDIIWTMNNNRIYPPRFQNIYAVRNNTKGYFIICVSDTPLKDRVNRIQFPTWTVLANQTDIVGDWKINKKCSGLIYNDFVVYQVNISDYRGIRGNYATDIYTYDDNNNYIKHATLIIDI